ncbi:hypothetical protein G6F37_010537 [Rhizopus arrhizus]|nr:hypothetical protein G6F38_010585 [Rhizopus arrhizus]KAG1153233.1 hypothetical protein G6F37_010537 [Rhizopus arrhizus]
MSKINAGSSEDTEMKEAPPKKERSVEYNVYTDEDRRRHFYFLKEKLMKPKQAANTANVNFNTAHAVESLTASFANLQIKKSRVAEFMKEECNLSIKVVSRHPLGRNKEENLQVRADWVDKWVKNGIDYLGNCIFVDGSGFDINMRRSRGWSPRGEDAVVTTPPIKATSHSVLGAISAVGVVNITPEDKLSVPKSTTGEHYLQFISDTMDIMDEFPEMRGYFIIMDNAPIHVPEMIDPVIMKQGYTHLLRESLKLVRQYILLTFKL